MKKRIFSALLALMFCFTLLPSEAWAVDTAEEYDYYISSAERLIELLGNGNTAYLDKSFLLTEDIRLSGSWTPVSTFTGAFDGGGHTISGMYTYGGGFFGVIGEGGTVRNLCVDGEFNAGGNAGGISAFNYGLIENCINKGTGNGYWSHVGGIVARNESTGTIRNCYNIGYVYNDGANTGGIVAENHGTIVNCFNVGTVIGTANSDNVTVKSSDGIVTNCYYSTDNGETFKNYDDPEDVITPAELAERIGDEGLVTPDGDFAFKLYSLKGKGIQEEP